MQQLAHVVLHPGDVYLSSPAFFSHCLQKFRAEDAIAIQFRVAVPVDEGWADPTRKTAGANEASKMGDRVATVFSQQGWRFRTLREASLLQTIYRGHRCVICETLSSTKHSS